MVLLKNSKKRGTTGKRCSVITKLLSVILALTFLVSNFGFISAYADNVTTLTLSKSVDQANPLTGANFVYTIKYANPSTTQDAYDAVLTDVFPSNISYVSNITSDDIANVDVSNDGTHDIVKFMFTH